MKYEVTERFKSIQGEGAYTGTPMAFIRFVGCSVGKRICHACDTDFDRPLPWRGGGTYSEKDLLLWAAQSPTYPHICLTGGEPFDQDLEPLFRENEWAEMFHIETSGTVPLPDWWSTNGGRGWLCVSPKPGWDEHVVMVADEVKVIVPGLGNDKGLPVIQLNTGTGSATRELHWPTLTDALRWADAGKLVYLQPRNAKFDIDHVNLMYVQDLLREYPNLRLSTQMHKVLKVQ